MDAKAQIRLQEDSIEESVEPRESRGVSNAIVTAEHIAKQFQIYLNDRSRFFEFF